MPGWRPSCECRGGTRSASENRWRSTVAYQPDWDRQITSDRRFGAVSQVHSRDIGPLSRASTELGRVPLRQGKSEPGQRPKGDPTRLARGLGCSVWLRRGCLSFWEERPPPAPAPPPAGAHRPPRPAGAHPESARCHPTAHWAGCPRSWSQRAPGTTTRSRTITRNRGRCEDARLDTSAPSDAGWLHLAESRRPARGWTARSVTYDEGSWSSAAGMCRRRRRIPRVVRR